MDNKEFEEKLSEYADWEYNENTGGPVIVAMKKEPNRMRIQVARNRHTRKLARTQYKFTKSNK